MKESSRIQVPTILFLLALLNGNSEVIGNSAVAQNCPHASETTLEKDDLVLKVITTMIESLQPIVVQAVENKLKALDVLEIQAKMDIFIQKEEEKGKYVENLFDNTSKKLLEIEQRQLKDSNKLEKITSSLNDSTSIILSDMKENVVLLQNNTSETLIHFLKVTEEKLSVMEHKISHEMEATKRDIREVNDKLMEMEEEAKNTNNNFSAMMQNVKEKVDTIPSVVEIFRLLSQVNESTTSAKSRSDENQKQISAMDSIAKEIKEVVTEIGNLKNNIVDTGNKLQVMESKLSIAVTTVGDNIVTAVTKAESEIGIRLSDIALEYRNDIKAFTDEKCGQNQIPVTSNCAEIQKSWQNTSGSYSVMVPFTPLQVYCDMETEGGGWTVFQKRDDVNPHEDFDRDWADYKRGFGDLSKEFWLGLDAIHALTFHQSMSLRVDLEDFEGNKKFAFYRKFSIGNERDRYRLSIEGYQGDAGDSLNYHNGRAFSTKDRDNDDNSNTHCAKWLHGGWWYGACHCSNLNGIYLNGQHNTHQQGVIWDHKKGRFYSLKKTEMKIRPTDF